MNKAQLIDAIAERAGRNPQTGKTIQIPAKKVVRFKAGAELEGQLSLPFKRFKRGCFEDTLFLFIDKL